MDEKRALAILDQVGGVIANDHFVYASGKHGEVYVNKRAVYPNTFLAEEIGAGIAEMFRIDRIETVIGPAMGAIVLAQWVAHGIRRKTGRMIHAVYADKT